MSKYFKDISEGGTDILNCTHCGETGMDPEFMNWLDAVRHDCGFPMKVTSGYRCAEHPIEAAKIQPGAHSTGRAVDIAVADAQAIKVIEKASKLGCTRVGVKANVFIHLDRSERHSSQLWTYG